MLSWPARARTRDGPGGTGYITSDIVHGQWLMVDGATNVPGHFSGTMALTGQVDSIQRNYRVGVSRP